MPDYGHGLLFGAFLTPLAAQSENVVTVARIAEATGLDVVAVQDHPYQPAFLDAWTLLTHIAAKTERVRLVPDVANLPLRPPAMLARAAASLDILSDGRVELGLGTGAFWDAIVAMGGPRRSPRAAVDALVEAIEVIRALWAPGRTPRIDGDHYSLAGAKPGPFPVHPVGIWLGAYGPRMLELTGRTADGWLPSQGYAPPERLTDLNARIDAAATATGREPSVVRRVYNIDGRFGTGSGFLQGTVDDWVEQLADLALREGISGFLLGADPGSARALQTYAQEVAPAVRDVVDHERAAPTEPASVGPAPAPAVVVTSSAPPTGLSVVATPDDGTRLSTEAPWDESERPGPLPVDVGRAYTASGQTDAGHLVAIHDHLRAELAQLRDLVGQVAAGNRDVGDARSLISTMTMRQNSWTLGTFCETYCRVVSVHHTIEDQGMFPRMRAADAALSPVLDRLEAEHHVIAGILDRVDGALVAMVADPGELTEVQSAVDLLTDALRSHLAYEERVLVEPLARLDMRLV